jgi:hypothetical protein
MSLRDRFTTKASEWMQKTDPACPICKTKGLWHYGLPELLTKQDLETGASSVSRIVRITCAKCEHEMPHFEEETWVSN